MEAQLGFGARVRRDAGVWLGSALVGYLRWVADAGCGCPASQKVQRFFGARAWLGGVREEREAVVGGDVETVEAEAEFADDGVVKELVGGGVEADVVDLPMGAELLALSRELADEV